MRTSRAIAPLVVVAALLLVVLAAPVAAQDGFRIVYEPDTSRPERVRLVGMVTNDRSGDVFEVSVMAEALNQSGKIVARGVAYVDSRIPRGGSRPFSVSVPAVPGIVRYRVAVSSFRAGLGGDSP